MGFFFSNNCNQTPLLRTPKPQQIANPAICFNSQLLKCGTTGWTSGQRAGRKSWNYGFGLVIWVTASSRAIRDPCQSC
ncbi:hypothetical protein Pyn_13582 [Prunus yedoensis var. nudiflora]|uniref:Uncharacterized protein n=1 Tax=Prunus yedoensis var. nudiflora TaxID=2094558 RepID=A0A314V3T6_PRUYE|nr:hypothetical protein Pyn_13582 [Prunus yedoensis var. nudiflora]